MTAKQTWAAIEVQPIDQRKATLDVVIKHYSIDDGEERVLRH